MYYRSKPNFKRVEKTKTRKRGGQLTYEHRQRESEAIAARLVYQHHHCMSVSAHQLESKAIATPRTVGHFAFDICCLQRLCWYFRLCREQGIFR